MNTIFTLPFNDLSHTLVAFAGSFVLAVIATPFLTNFLYKNRIGKRLRQKGVDGKDVPIFLSLHKDKAGTPVMGGLLFWVTTAIITLLFNLDRSQTWLPVFVLVASGLIGAIDDLMNVQGKGHNGGGLRMMHKFWIFVAIAVIGAWWFYTKLGWDALYIPIKGSLVSVGWWYVPLFIGVVVYTGFSMNQTDGLDGLAGGVSAIACFVFVFICLVQGKTNLAIFCATLLGSLLAFLWFNIYPARFFMGDTGSFALGMTLPIIAFLTNSAVALPFILLIPFIEGLSTIIQIISKKVFHRKVFRVAPIHHHFEAIGWPETKVTMRFWVIAALGAGLGLLLMVTR